MNEPQQVFKVNDVVVWNSGDGWDSERLEIILDLLANSILGGGRYRVVSVKKVNGEQKIELVHLSTGVPLIRTFCNVAWWGSYYFKKA